MRAAARPFQRRRGRRGTQPAEESWFGAVGVADDTQLPGDEWAPDDSRLEGGWQGAEQAQADSRFLSRQARRIISSGLTAFQRLYAAFIGARLALGLALLLALGVSGMFGAVPTRAVVVVSVLYAGLALALWVMPRARQAAGEAALNRLRRRQWLATIGVDILCFTALHALSPGAPLNYVALLVMPVLMAGVLTPRRLALATASAVTLALLAVAWLSAPDGGEATQLLAQAGLAGAGFFVITVLAGELAGRLAREELTARGSLALARQQAELNRLVIEEMQDGVLVVDRRGRVRAANPAARALLAPSGMCHPAPFALQGVEAWDALVKAVERAFVEATWPEAGRDVALAFESGPQRTLRVRVRFTRPADSPAAEEFCVLLLEDERNMRARMQQEKLAAMGRVSAGIAHEIRNPLAAIAQANALLLEDAADPVQQRLMGMVADNVERLKRIVDDVMEAAPGAAREAVVIDVAAQVASVCGEWARATRVALGERSVLRVELTDASLGARFDPHHLRRVLVNLLDNALRHASAKPGAVLVRLHPKGEDMLRLSVMSDGPAIRPEVERHLFEPFFSTRSRGTGLGLYICRELCERYGGSIEYRLRPPGEANRNEFLVTLPRAKLAAAEQPLRLTP